MFDDVDGAVLALKAKGLTFEHYDMPGMTRQDDGHSGGGMKIAWFKDPEHHRPIAGGGSAGSVRLH